MSAEKAEKTEFCYLIPSLAGPIFLFMLALFCFARPLLLLGDGGTCRHIQTGLYLLEKHALPQTTYMSAIEPNSAWTTHELLCDLIFGLPFNLFGLNWVLLASAIAISLSLSWAYQIARLRGAGMLLSISVLLLVLEACTVHWSARPHLFTYLPFLAFYYECFVSESSFKKRCIWIFVLMLIWSNLHGSFPLGIIMILSRFAGDLIERLKNQRNQASERSASLWTLKESALVLCTAIVASCINIRGFSFITYIISYLISPKIHANSDEWRSIDFSFQGPVWSFIMLFSLSIFFWTYSRIKPRLSEFAYFLFLFIASLYAMRLIPYFALLSLPAMSRQAGEVLGRESLFAMPITGKLLAADKKASKMEMKLQYSGPLFLLLSTLLCAAFLLLPAFKISDFDPERLPVKAVDYMKAHNISGLGYTKDNWAAYLYWRLKSPVFIDDKTDFYSQKSIDDYSAIYMTVPGWQKKLQEYQFKYILIPRGLPLELMLEQGAAGKDDLHWQRVFLDNTSVLFIKKKNL